jgi:hypothetical protein
LRGVRRSRLRPDGDHPSRFSTVAVFAAIVAALLPYVLAETQTGFRNTRAMFSHVEAASGSGRAEGPRAAMDTLILAADPMTVFPEQRPAALALGASIASAALLLLLWRRGITGAPVGSEGAVLLWLIATTIIGVAGQALFFFLMARPLNGMHYAMLIAPWYAIPPAALLAVLVPDGRHPVTALASAVLGTVAVVLLLVRAPALADRFAERTPWNFGAIVDALDALCSGQAVHTVEGPGLLNDLTPASDPVLRYLLKRGFTRCRYESDSDIVIAASRDAAFDQEIEVDGRRFTRTRVLPPGLALYRQVP